MGQSHLRCSCEMADISNLIKEMDDQLQPPEVKEIKFLLRDTLSSKLHRLATLS